MPETPVETGGQRGYLRIATEEAFATTEQIALYRELLEEPGVDPGFQSLMGFYINSTAERPRFIFENLQDLGDRRIAEMDARGIDRQVIGITAPGTHVLDRDRAVALARNANDELAAACSTHPDRFTGMAACAPQDPLQAAAEIDRAVSELGLRAVVYNSHVQGEYLDDQRFWPILEAAEALDVPIYLHPNTPPADMIQPMLRAGLDGAIFGFGVETGMHALRIITSGALDRFPRLQIILGHMGEALPFWLYRLDYMHQATVKSGRYEAMRPLRRGAVSEYLRENFIITNSGVAWPDAIDFTQRVMGVERVMYAMDFPYQCPVEEVEELDRMDMPLDAKRAFFQTNAERVFGLAQPVDGGRA
ncbi:amidohydrolase family protein [Microbacterium sp. 18062]|uniref:amidohydrolase family protein n=1 Tax=Microbacterium sp. 18062 TaxID=2681410 RepID=UPI00135BFA0B|nr:amidohydrolase family protein [Microbacterium sp. 18062]